MVYVGGRGVLRGGVGEGGVEGWCWCWGGGVEGWCMLGERGR